VIFYARELSGLQLFGWPIPFYMAAQGTILIYLLIIGAYAFLVNRLERKLALVNGAKDENESA
jgi:putative solute:sodium symporter small subunit